MDTEVKICGLTRSIDAELADASGASYLGVIFAGGPRNRTPEEAREVLLARRARKVGVFGSQSVEEIARIASLVGLDVVQLHGLGGVGADERADLVRAARAATGLEVWAVVRTRDGVLTSADESLADAADALVIDALVPGTLGGSGAAVPWLELGESLDAMQSGHRVVLAGGLTPENVCEAIDYVSPHVVDVSSGVESAPGIKDHQRVRAFIAAVRASTESEG